MVAPRVLLVDDNESFGSQVMAAFSEAGFETAWVARGADALPFLDSEAQRPRLLIVDLVRPASSGLWLLERLRERDQTSAPLALALTPVVGSYHELPDGVEVQVKPIFPNQVVASARRLLGMAPPTSGMAPSTAVHRLPTPSSGSLPTLRQGAQSDELTAARPTADFDQFEDNSSDFGPADTLLAPSNIEELARAMTGGLADEMLRVDNESARSPGQPRSRTRRQFPALPMSGISPNPADSDPKTTPLLRYGEIPALTRPAAPESAATADSTAALAGDLAMIPLVDVLTLLERQKQSGVLHVFATSGLAQNPGTAEPQITVIFKKGRVEQASAVGFPELRLGRFVMEAAALSLSQIDEIAARQLTRGSDEEITVDGLATAEDKHLLGLRLCHEGMLSSQELQQALSRQTVELIYAAIRLPAGRFRFLREAVEAADIRLVRRAVSPELGAALGLDVLALLLEGYRRIRDHLSIDKDVEEGAVYVSTAQLSGPAAGSLNRLGLSDGEVAVLGLCNGRHSLDEIAKEVRLPLLDVARALKRLETLRLCRRRLPAMLAS